MGGQLARSMSSKFAQLPGTQFKALNRMCWIAFDRPTADHPARTWYAGWEELALAMGWRVPDKTPENRSRRKAMRGEVNKVYKALEAAGAIEECEHPYDGRRKAYRVLPT